MSARSQTSRPQGKLNLRDVAYERIVASITAARLSPGQFVSQRELVTLTGVPLSAVREAIPRLEAERLLETIPKRGLQIAAIDLRMVREVFDLWRLVGKAAAEKLSQSAPNEVLEELERVHQESIISTVSPNGKPLEQGCESEDRFHRLLTDSLDNSLVRDLYRVNKIKLEMIRISQGGPCVHDTNCSAQERAKVIQMARLRDPERAARAMEDHVSSTMRRTVALLAEVNFTDGIAASDRKRTIAA